MSIGAPQYRDVETKLGGNADIVLVQTDAYHIRADGEGTVNLDLPTEVVGLAVFIENFAGETLTVMASDGTTTVGSLLTTEAMKFECNGTSWENPSALET